MHQWLTLTFQWLKKKTQEFFCSSKDLITFLRGLKLIINKQTQQSSQNMKQLTLRLNNQRVLNPEFGDQLALINVGKPPFDASPINTVAVQFGGKRSDQITKCEGCEARG